MSKGYGVEVVVLASLRSFFFVPGTELLLGTRRDREEDFPHFTHKTLAYTQLRAELKLEVMKSDCRVHDFNCPGITCDQVLDLNCGLVWSTVWLL